MSQGVPRFRRDRKVHAQIAVDALSTGGDAAWTVAVAWTAVQLASPAVAGLIVAAGTIPRAAVLLFGGVVADRVDALRLMRITNLVRAVVVAAVAVVDLTHGISVGLLVAASVCFGVADAFYTPSSATIPRQLARPEDLPAYYGVAQTARRIGTMAGAALGGVLVAMSGIWAVALMDAATFLVHAAFLLVLRPRFPLPRATAESALAGIRAGFGYLRGHPATRTVVLSLSGLNLAVGPAMTLGIAVRAEAEGWGPSMVGLASALVGAGAVLGALGLVPVRPRRIAAWGYGMLVVQGLVIMSLGFGDRVLTGIGCVVIGITAGAASTMLSAVFASVVEPDYHGRMASIQALGDDVFMPGANATFGALASATAVAVPFVAFGGAMALMMLAALGRKTVRTLEIAGTGGQNASARTG
ncbi:MFS transporter [Nocardioides albus]|uniref:MFS family permease n=1 Tax=Nocardioides albus TaxID=1841 RepID=A0A7W5FB99_9ACTN|nr:MFS transporter [Nocardioides albus]MBB3092007.1 MFS family permease [Nocardioides albus]GGU43805.1 MFS transporter [Nocardioides albus]